METDQGSDDASGFLRIARIHDLAIIRGRLGRHARSREDPRLIVLSNAFGANKYHANEIESGRHQEPTLT
jgi:hypothetical protein